MEREIVLGSGQPEGGGVLSEKRRRKDRKKIQKIKRKKKNIPEEWTSLFSFSFSFSFFFLVLSRFEEWTPIIRG
jgi:hypothetical protein